MTQEQAVEAVIKIASGEIGYREKETNSNLDSPTANAGKNNWNKFARDLDAIGYYNGKKNIGKNGEWCDIFVDWCFWKAFGGNGRIMLCQPERSMGAGAKYSAQYFKNNGAFSSVPQKGSQIFFLSTDGVICHTGLVESFDSTYVRTIEGNSNNTVERHAYYIKNSRIAGYGIPRWVFAADVTQPSAAPIKDEAKKEEPKNKQKEVVNVEIRQLSKGYKGADVKAMQLLLIGNGVSCGSCGADGDFGSATLSAVKEFQKKNNLTQDGICGVKTWGKLING